MNKLSSELDSLWSDCAGGEILYLWYDLLQERSVEILELEEGSVDITEMVKEALEKHQAEER